MKVVILLKGQAVDGKMLAHYCIRDDAVDAVVQAGDVRA